MRTEQQVVGNARLGRQSAVIAVRHRRARTPAGLRRIPSSYDRRLADPERAGWRPTSSASRVWPLPDACHAHDLTPHRQRHVAEAGGGHATQLKGRIAETRRGPENSRKTSRPTMSWASWRVSLARPRDAGDAAVAEHGDRLRISRTSSSLWLMKIVVLRRSRGRG